MISVSLILINIIFVSVLFPHNLLTLQIIRREKLNRVWEQNERKGAGTSQPMQGLFSFHCPLTFLSKHHCTALPQLPGHVQQALGSFKVFCYTPISNSFSIFDPLIHAHFPPIPLIVPPFHLISLQLKIFSGIFSNAFLKAQVYIL